jgi:hypothetical protein
VEERYRLSKVSSSLQRQKGWSWRVNKCTLLKDVNTYHQRVASVTFKDIRGPNAQEYRLACKRLDLCWPQWVHFGSQEHHRTSWNPTEPHGISWNLMEPHGIPWNLMESRRTSWNPAEPHGIPRNLMEGSGTWRNLLVADK